MKTDLLAHKLTQSIVPRRNSKQLSATLNLSVIRSLGVLAHGCTITFLLAMAQKEFSALLFVMELGKKLDPERDSRPMA